jgi:CRISPR-associated protein Cmr6
LGKAHQGNLTFFDALPTEKPTLQPDVMNPHYPDYYSKKSAPTDTQSPIPVFFLTVAKTSFRFIIGSKKWNLDSTQFWDKTIEEWLVDALQEHGIGAKTAVGYGYMKPA